MSQLAALLMMYLHDEEDVFWAIDRLMSADRYAMHGFFIPGFPKLTRFSRHHDKILQKFLRSVAKHFKKFDIDSTLYTLKWFFQCFLDRVPFSLTLRLWDCFMLDGEVILTGMSYTLLKLHKSKYLCPDSFLMSFFNDLFSFRSHDVFVAEKVIRKGMEELLEFLQVDLEKDFGYHDDDAINALAQSIAELRKYKMDLPLDAPSESEKPIRPFGILLQADNVSLYTMTDNQSTVGSIVIRPDGTSAVDNALTSSEEDLAHETEVGAERQRMQHSEAASIDKQTMTLSAKEICDDIKFIDSATNALNTPDVELENLVLLDREQETASRNEISEIVRMVEEMEREQFGTQTNGSTSNGEHFGTDTK